jgi:dihydrofolate reductase
MSRNVVLYALLSLDGVAEEPGDWMFDGGEEVFANLGRVIESQDDILFGRSTYEYWVDFWPTSDVEPFATFVNTTRKHVFTSTPRSTTWSNTVVVTDPAVDYVRALKSQPGADIGVHGSIRLAQSLLDAGLIDQLEFALSPVVAGHGRRLFGDTSAQQGFDLVGARSTPKGTLLVSYRRPAQPAAAEVSQ